LEFEERGPGEDKRKERTWAEMGEARKEKWRR